MVPLTLILYLISTIIAISISLFVSSNINFGINPEIAEGLVISKADELDIGTIFSPLSPNKGNFIGLEALNKWREKGFDNKLVTLEVHNTTDSDVLGNNPIYKDDKVVGRATGGEYGFRIDKSIALAMVKPDLANVGEKLKVDILGKMYEATILEESPYDSENKLLRA